MTPLRTPVGIPALVALLLTLGCDPRSRAGDDRSGGAPAASAAADLPADAPEVVVTPGEVLASPGLVGRRVRITGRCFGERPAPASVRPPRGRVAWALESGGVVIYVTGPLPDDCLTTSDEGATVTIVALVAEDTLPPLRDLPGAPRRYLTRLVDDAGARGQP